MALLGFGAIGRHALGQLPALGLTNTVLLATGAGYSAAGQGAAFRSVVLVNSASFASTGSGAAFGHAISATTVGFGVVTNAAPFLRTLSAGSFGCTIGGTQTTALLRMPSVTGTLVLAGRTVTFTTAAAQGTGSYLAFGYPSSFGRNFESWFPRPFERDAWTNSTADGETWTSKDPNTIPWMTKADPAVPWTPAAGQIESWTIE